MNVLIDGCIYQDAKSETVLVWNDIFISLLRSGASLYILDRGNCPLRDEMTYLPFPSYNSERVTAADSIMLQNMCDQYKIDVFISTQFTTPLTTASICILLEGGVKSAGSDSSCLNERELSLKHASRAIAFTTSVYEKLLSDVSALCRSPLLVSCKADQGKFEINNSELDVALKIALKDAVEDKLGTFRPGFYEKWTALRYAHYQMDCA